MEESKAPLINVTIDALYLGTRFPRVRFAIKIPNPPKFSNESDKYNNHDLFGVAKPVTNDPAKNTIKITLRMIQLPNRSRQ